MGDITGQPDQIETAEPPKRKRGRPRKHADDAAAYERVKERARQRSAELALAGKELGELPAVKDQTRKDACRLDLRLFLLTYLARMFPLAFSADHERVIAILQDAVLSGGRLSVAMPRGSGKSTIALGAIIWMLVFGHRKFPVVVAATA